MENFTSVFIGIVDVLGYSRAEHRIDQYGKQAASSILKGVFDRLDQITLLFNINGVYWIRYGDGYVFYSETNNVEHLEKMIKDASRLIAFSFSQSIPLRIAITQGDIKIIGTQQKEGLSITGSGWNILQSLEKALDWMGGWLYIPNYDNHHHPTITKLINTTHLIIQHGNCDEQTHNFTAPFKSSTKYSKERAWFLNWHKVLHQNNQDIDGLIDNWWLPFTHANINDHPDVKKKQENTREFAHYCNLLYKSAKLVYFSNLTPDLKISEITSSN